MPLKKSPKKEEVKKKTSEKCKFHNRGYCNLKEECENIHSDKVCDDLDCSEINCNKRHPNPCKFGPRCKFNKKNECMYLHVTLAFDDEKCEALKLNFNKHFEKQDNCMMQMLSDLEQKNSEIKLLNEKYNKLENLVNENHIIDLKKDFEIRIAHINGLDMRIEELEKDYQSQKKEQGKKIKELENAFKQKAKKVKVSEDKISEENSFQCNNCDFSTTSKQGLKIHNTKIHSRVNFEEFPAACDICEKVLENVTNLSKHKKAEHTFHNVKYQCNECEFMANEVQTLHVHFGINHSIKKQCGLCDKNFENSKLLEDHHSECEIFLCSNSGCKDSFEKER